VIGYSGENDNIFPLFEEFAPFMGGIYWVVHHSPNSEGQFVPSLKDRAREFLKNKTWAADVIKSYGADATMIELAWLLNEFPPPVFLKPAEHLSEILRPVGELDNLHAGPPVLLYSKELIERIKGVADFAEDCQLLFQFFTAVREEDRLRNLGNDAAARTDLSVAFRESAASILLFAMERIESQYSEEGLADALGKLEEDASAANRSAFESYFRPLEFARDFARAASLLVRSDENKQIAAAADLKLTQVRAAFVF